MSQMFEEYGIMETTSKAGSSKEFSSQIPEKDEERPSSPAEAADCAICLDRLTDKAFTNGCLHMFCFGCLLAWSKIKPECPLCKQEFHSIIHNIRSMTDYDEYDVPPPQARLSVFVNPNIRPSASFERSHQDFFAHHPSSFVSYRTTITSGAYRVPRRRPDNLLIQPYVDNLEIQADFSRMQSDPTEYSRFNRREIYLRELETLPPPTPGRYRQCSPGFYNENEVQVNRLIRWLHRECTVLAQITTRFTASEFLRAVVDMLTVYHINSTTFYNNVNQYLGQHTARFIREFHRFATSPLDQDQYDADCLYVRQRGSQVSFIVTIDRDDSEDVQIIPNTTNHAFTPWIDVNDLGRAQSSTSTSTIPPSPQSGLNRYPAIGLLSHGQNSHSAHTGHPSASSMSQTVIDISDSENDDCVIIEQVRNAQETILLVDDTDAEDSAPSTSASGITSPEEKFKIAQDPEKRRVAPVATASSNNGPSRGSSVMSTDPSSGETTGELRTKLKRKRSKKYYRTKERSNNVRINYSSDELIVLSDTTEVETDDNDSDWEESYKRRRKSKKISASKRSPLKQKKGQSAVRRLKSSMSRKSEKQTTSNKSHQDTTNVEAQTSNAQLQLDLPRLRSVARKAKNQSVTNSDNSGKTEEMCVCGNIDRSEDEPGPSHGIRHYESCQFYSVTPISKYVYSSDSD